MLQGDGSLAPKQSDGWLQLHNTEPLMRWFIFAYYMQGVVGSLFWCSYIYCMFFPKCFIVFHGTNMLDIKMPIRGQYNYVTTMKNIRDPEYWNYRYSKNVLIKKEFL